MSKELNSFRSDVTIDNSNTFCVLRHVQINCLLLKPTFFWGVGERIGLMGEKYQRTNKITKLTHNFQSYFLNILEDNKPRVSYDPTTGRI